MSNAAKNPNNASLEEIKDKIINLQNALDEELSLQEPIVVALPKNLKKRIEAQNKTLRQISKQVDKKLTKKKIKDISKKLDDVSQKMESLLWDKRKLDKEAKQKNPNKELQGNLSGAFIKMRTRMFLMKMRYHKLSKQLNNLNLHLIYGISSLAEKDDYFKNNREKLEAMRFKPRQRLGEKAAFALMRLRASKLIKLINKNLTDDAIKDKFVEAFDRINNNTGDDDVRASRLKKFVSMIKQAKDDGVKLSRDNIRSEMQKIQPSN